MATESSWITRSTTLTEKLQHPVKDFLEECGIDVAHFPRLYILTEVQEAVFKNTQVYIPLRIPGRPGVIFESYCRVLRATDVPRSDGSGHRKFLELEWHIEEDPLLEAEHHAVFSFLSGEVECPSCRSLFNPEPSILDDRSVKVTCNHCLHYWTIKVDSPVLDSPRLRMITDSFYKDPSKIQKSLADWDLSAGLRSESEYGDYFPVEFEGFSPEDSLEFIFGSRPAYRIKKGSLGSDFEVLSKSLINLLAFNYFRKPSAERVSKLEKTDVCRKSEVVFKEEQRKKLHTEFFPAREFEEIRTEPSSSPFESLYTGNTAIREIQFSNPYPHAKASSSRWAVVASIAASFIMIGGVAAYFWVQRTPEPETQLAQVIQETSEVESPIEAFTVEPEPVLAAKKIEEPIKQAPPVAPEVAAVKPAEPEVQEELPPVVEPKVVAKPSPPVEEPKVVVKPEPDGRQLAKLALVDAGYRQGMLHLKLQQAKEAASEFERVIELDPRHTESYRNLGLAYVYDRRFEEAVSAFEKYLSLAGESEDRSSVEELLVTLRDRVSLSEAR